MNTRLEYQTKFSAGLVHNEEYHINHYDVTINIITNTVDTYEQNIAFDRIKYWLHDVVGNGVLIGHESSLLDAYGQTGQRVIALPDLPYDQIVELMLYTKISAIVEDRMIITDIKLSSSMGDNVCYLYSDDESIGPFENDGWWSLSTPHYTSVSKNKKKVVSLTKVQSWDAVGLSWDADADADAEVDDKLSSVVFVNFAQNETE